jgi:16S rRNA (guanine966-N2)-methyltransferase
MRIIAGLAKGSILAVPRGDQVRPTSDRVREAVFSSLGARVLGAVVLDLFAGSGSLGLEAASRGASRVVFVENARASIAALEQNIAAYQRNRDAGCPFQIERASVEDFLRHGTDTRYDLIFADPPYGPFAQELLDHPTLPDLLKPDGLLVLESAKRTSLAASVRWTRQREAIYGDTRVSFLRRHAA